MSEIQPYESTSPGDLITADLFNRVQVETRKDILAQVKKAIEALNEVERAENAGQLEGKTAQQLSDEIVERALRQIPGRTGYRCVFKRLQPDEPAIIRHGLAAYPLVDVYELQRFPAVVSADGRSWNDTPHFFAYHATEKKTRDPDPAAGGSLVTIEESRGPVFKHSLQSMLDLHQVPYDDQSTLGDVMTELWKALFSDPNDPFDETSFGNSPWFDRCCGDRRTVESLKRGRDWNDLFIKLVPRKTINSLVPVRPLGVEVVHYDMNTVGLLRADFARLTLGGMEDVFEASEGPQAKSSPLVDGGGPLQPDSAQYTERVATRGGVVGHQQQQQPGETREDLTIEEVASRMERAAVAEVAERGRPEPGELFLMVLLKV